MRLRILDIDGSLSEQRCFAAAAARRRVQVVDLRSEERALRLWAGRRRMRGLAARLRESPPEGDGPTMTFYGSGDYHHLAVAMMAAIDEPLTVVHFDNHADWIRLPATHNCGSWVNRALEMPQVKRVVTLGICSDDLALPQLKTGNVAALASGRLEVHAWRAAPSRVWGRIGDGPGHRQVGGHLVWNCRIRLEGLSFLRSCIERIPTEAIWVTIDKDVLRREDAATNWDQGEMPLDTLIASLRELCAGRRVVGVDVCGEYSQPRFSSLIKRLAAWLDHPRIASRPPGAAELNGRTNRKLVEVLEQVLP